MKPGKPFSELCRADSSAALINRTILTIGTQFTTKELLDALRENGYQTRSGADISSRVLPHLKALRDNGYICVNNSTWVLTALSGAQWVHSRFAFVKC